MVASPQNPDNPWKSAFTISRWELAALVGTLFILISPFFYLMRSEHSISLPAEEKLQFIGSKKCGSCHQETFSKWQESHHDSAMDEATEQSVLGGQAGVYCIKKKSLRERGSTDEVSMDSAM